MMTFLRALATLAIHPEQPFSEAMIMSAESMHAGEGLAPVLPQALVPPIDATWNSSSFHQRVSTVKRMPAVMVMLGGAARVVSRSTLSLIGLVNAQSGWFRFVDDIMILPFVVSVMSATPSI